MSDPTLARRLTWIHGSAMAIGAVLGSGILILPAVTAQEAGPAALMAWGLMAALSFPLAMTLGRLGSAYPHAGGIVEYVRVAWGPRAGRITAWLFVGTIPLGVPIIALIGAHYAARAFFLPAWTIPGIAAGLLGGSLALHRRGVELAGWIQVLVLALIATLIVAAIALASPHVQGIAFYPWAPHGWVPVGTSAVAIFWCFVGWEMVGHLAEEFRCPARDLRRTFIIAPTLVGVLYLGLLVVTVGTHAYGAGHTLTPFSQLVQIGFGRVGAQVTGVVALLITAVAIHGNIAGFSRMVYSQARAGVFPSWLARMNPGYQTPTMALHALAIDFALVLTIDVVFHVNLQTLILGPSTVFLVLYSLAMAAALKLLPSHGTRMRLLPGVALVICLALMPFSGWVLLYPLGLAALGWALSRPRVPDEVNEQRPRDGD